MVIRCRLDQLLHLDWIKKVQIDKKSQNHWSYMTKSRSEIWKKLMKIILVQYTPFYAIINNLSFFHLQYLLCVLNAAIFPTFVPIFRQNIFFDETPEPFCSMFAYKKINL